MSTERATAKAGDIAEIAPSRREAAEPLGDLRFRALLSDADWARLPPAVRRRFSKRLAAGGTAVYAGAVVEARMSRAGRLLAQVLRLLGGPLPTECDAGVPAVVSVTEDAAGGGQVWTRVYGRRRGFPQVIHSRKLFRGPTGLEERVRCGVGMTLTVAVEDRALVFRSDRYFIGLGRWRAMLPAWATPGALTVKHIEETDERFLFSLEIVHPLLGTLIRQVAAFREAEVGATGVDHSHDGGSDPSHIGRSFAGSVEARGLTPR
jgi:hypothetical protein